MSPSPAGGRGVGVRALATSLNSRADINFAPRKRYASRMAVPHP
ncbi:hypothetical protein [Lysobacter gummosus]